MKKIRFTLLACCIMQLMSFQSTAQTYQPFPTGTARWNIDRCWYFFNPGWYDLYSIHMDGSDTVYQGETFKKLTISSHMYHPPFDSITPYEFFGGIREENKQVFIFQKWGSIDTTSHLIYDFTNTDVGDTIYTSALFAAPGDLYPHVVSAVDSVLLGATYHKRLLLQDPNSGMDVEYWTEGVGSSWGLPFASFWNITDNSYELLCFSESGQLLYSNPNPTFSYCQQPFPVISCDSLLSTKPELPIVEGSLHLYPNPANELVTIEVDQWEKGADLTLFMYNSSGSLVRTVKIGSQQQQVSTADLTEGIYVIEVRSREHITRQKLLIQR